MIDIRSKKRSLGKKRKRKKKKRKKKIFLHPFRIETWKSVNQKEKEAKRTREKEHKEDLQKKVPKAILEKPKDPVQRLHTLRLLYRKFV